MPLTEPRNGKSLQINKREVPYSIWPTKTGRNTSQPMLFVHNPWGALDTFLQHKIKKLSLRTVATSFLNQAREYYIAGLNSNSIESQPTLYYYSLLNLVKFIFCLKNPDLVESKNRIMHGITVDDLSPPILKSSMTVYKSTPDTINAFHELVKIYDKIGIRKKPETIFLSDILAEQIAGHRLWAEAQKKLEHFINVYKIEILHCQDTLQVWLRMHIMDKDLGMSGKRMLNALRLSGLADVSWCRTKSCCDELIIANISHHTLEQRAGVRYRNIPADGANECCQSINPYVYRLITSTRPYRRYYLKMHKSTRPLPQLASTYAMFFYLASITRYKPETFAGVLSGPYGGFIREQLAIQPAQMLFELTSLARQQEVAKGGVVSGY